MSDHDDFAFEPVPGLPEQPPKGETLLWQGRPQLWALAREAYALGWFAVYFAFVVIWRMSVAWTAAEPGQQVGAVVATGVLYAGLGLIGAAVILGIAYAQARTTVYTITTARVVMRIGAALPVTLNLPFKQIENATLGLRKSGVGTIALELTGNTRLAYLVLWPHCRPWFMKHPQPALRCIPEAQKISQILAQAAESRLSRPEVTRRDDADASGTSVPAQ